MRPRATPAASRQPPPNTHQSASQPAVSHALARLRDLLGDPLLLRSGRQMLLTPRAIAVAPAVRRLLNSALTLFDERAGFDPAESTRTFTIAAADYVERLLLVPLLTALREEAPRAPDTSRASADPDPPFTSADPHPRAMLTRAIAQSHTPADIPDPQAPQPPASSGLGATIAAQRPGRAMSCMCMNASARATISGAAGCPDHSAARRRLTVAYSAIPA